MSKLAPLETWVEETEAKARKILIDHAPRCRNPRCWPNGKRRVLFGIATRPWSIICPHCGFLNEEKDRVIQSA